MSDIVSLSFHRFDTVAARLWAFAMMGLARPAMARVPGLQFWKLCGSGTGEGFTPRPNVAVYAILAVWPDAARARAALREGPFASYARKAGESWTVLLDPVSVRGDWAGTVPFAAAPDAAARGAAPLAALTRATVRGGALRRFWARVPDISDVIGRDPDVAFKMGIGEVPWLHQVTFSIWPDAAAMDRFARRGPHAAAIRAVRDEGWFREELYARFAVAGEIGTWQGRSPLAGLAPDRTRLQETA